LGKRSGINSCDNAMVVLTEHKRKKTNNGHQNQPPVTKDRGEAWGRGERVDLKSYAPPSDRRVKVS